MNPTQHPHKRTHPRTGKVVVGSLFALAGLLFSLSARTAAGTELRPDRSNLADLITEGNDRVKERTVELTRVRAALAAERARSSRAQGASVQALEALQKAEQDAGLAPVTGPGLRVTLDDAPAAALEAPGVQPDDVVVHQQDVQAVVNALWLGGAEAMMIQDQRVISTSAVRCVGNTLILQGRVYSPPFSVTAIGDVPAMNRALADDPHVQLYRNYVDLVGLGYAVLPVPQASLPGYAGAISLRYAKPLSATTAFAMPTATAKGHP